MKTRGMTRFVGETVLHRVLAGQAAIPGVLLFLIGLSMGLQGCGTSEDGDLCRDVLCDKPPASACKDETTLWVYAPEGSCDPATGRCQFERNETPCERGCTAGRCLSENEAWGWIQILELNDAYLNGPFDGGSAKAFFAAEPRWYWAPEHQLAMGCTKEVEEGSCAVYQGEGRDLWEPACDPTCKDDEECVEENSVFFCRPRPRAWDVGTISIKGLKSEVVLSRDADRSFYFGDGWPEDLFDQGDTITTEATGGELGPFSLSATGVTHLEVTIPILELIKGKPATVSWTPADGKSRIQIILSGGAHYSHIYYATILCDVPDSDGQVVIPATLVNRFFEIVSGFGGIRRSSHITRYSRSSQAPFGKEIELTVGSVRLLQLVCECSPY